MREGGLSGWRREIGWHPSSATLTWSVVAAVLASFVLAAAMRAFAPEVGVLGELFAADNRVVLWAVHVSVGLVGGLLYGAFVRTDAMGPGFAYGVLFGTLVALALALLSGPLVGGPLPRGLAALTLLLAYAAWGGLLGVVAAWGVRRSRGPLAPQRALFGGPRG